MAAVFANLREALGAGYYIERRTPEGYAVRTRTRAGWTTAFVRTI